MQMPTSLQVLLLLPLDDDVHEEDADDDRDEMSSPGCLPIITSNVTIPKL